MAGSTFHQWVNEKMDQLRIIPRLDIKGPNLVKGIHLEGLRVLGEPADFAQHYYEQGADELIYQDVVASLYERNGLFELIAKTARNLFIPLTVGGGIRSVDDVTRALQSGADKVAINTAAIRDPDLISTLAKRFGSSTIIVAIETLKESDGSYLAYTDNGREHTRVPAIEWARKVERLGAGEILLTSIDREGTGKGFDVELIGEISRQVDIPVIAHGGAGSADDVASLSKATGCSGVALASILHYHARFETSVASRQDQDGSRHREGNREFLRGRHTMGNIRACSLPSLRDSLRSVGVRCRTSLSGAS
ncbi:MAG: imidazole glycerol phosphate synthase cyclase subunit [Planctomycetota bacterium]